VCTGTPVHHEQAVRLRERVGRPRPAPMLSLSARRRSGVASSSSAAPCVKGRPDIAAPRHRLSLPLKKRGFTMRADDLMTWRAMGLADIAAPRHRHRIPLPLKKRGFTMRVDDSMTWRAPT
jgi:hypothetical protein